MSSQLDRIKNSLVVQYIRSDAVQKRFERLIGKRAPQFIASLLQIVQSNDLLLKADPRSVLNAAAMAASLDLPINHNLGFAWIVPYNDKGQFQIGWKGYVQLAMRTGQYKALNVAVVYENQFRSFNALTEKLDADFAIEGEGRAVGYVGYFRLINGFAKTVYWSRKKVEVHARKYSQSYKKGYGVWAEGEDGFTAMAKKTVLKLMLSQWGIMTVEMQAAQIADQAVVDENGNAVIYPDNQRPNTCGLAKQEEEKRAVQFIEKAKTLEALEKVLEGYPNMSEEVREVYDKKELQLRHDLKGNEGEKILK